MALQPPPTDPGVSRALRDLQSVLIDGETIQAWAVQRRWFAGLGRRQLIAATSGRFISLTRGTVAGFTMGDLRWQDLKDAKLRLGLWAATLTLTKAAPADLPTPGKAPRSYTFEGFRKDEAREIYRLCQSHEQAWREKRRIRELEELRARSGGIHFAAPTNSSFPAIAASDTSNDALSRLQKAKQLLDSNLISDAEYESVKAKILESL